MRQRAYDIHHSRCWTSWWGRCHGRYELPRATCRQTRARSRQSRDDLVATVQRLVQYVADNNSHKHQFCRFLFWKIFVTIFKDCAAVSVLVLFHRQVHAHTHTHTQAISRVKWASINIQGVPKTHHHEYRMTNNRCTLLTVVSP